MAWQSRLDQFPAHCPWTFVLLWLVLVFGVIPSSPCKEQRLVKAVTKIRGATCALMTLVLKGLMSMFVAAQHWLDNKRTETPGVLWGVVCEYHHSFFGVRCLGWLFGLACCLLRPAVSSFFVPLNRAAQCTVPPPWAGVGVCSGFLKIASFPIRLSAVN